MKGKFVKVRTVHRCESCHNMIPKGSTAFSALKDMRPRNDGSMYFSRKYYCEVCVRGCYEQVGTKDEYGEEEWSFTGGERRYLKKMWIKKFGFFPIEEAEEMLEEQKSRKIENR